MQEAPIPDIDTGVIHLLATGREQYQVTWLQCIGRGLARQFAEAGGGSGQSDPGRLTEHVVDQSAAVEAGFRGAATPAVGRTDQAEGVEQDLVMERGLGGRLDCNSGRRWHRLWHRLWRSGTACQNGQRGQEQAHTTPSDGRCDYHAKTMG